MQAAHKWVDICTSVRSAVHARQRALHTPVNPLAMFRGRGKARSVAPHRTGGFDTKPHLQLPRVEQRLQVLHVDKLGVALVIRVDKVLDLGLCSGMGGAAAWWCTDAAMSSGGRRGG
jgi:hypothetical protein